MNTTVSILIAPHAKTEGERVNFPVVWSRNIYLGELSMPLMQCSIFLIVKCQVSQIYTCSVDLVVVCAVETLSEDEDDLVAGQGENISVSSNQYNSSSDFVPTPGGPFSALTPSMWPEDILAKLGNPVSGYDQRGFIIFQPVSIFEIWYNIINWFWIQANVYLMHTEQKDWTIDQGLVQ